MQTMQATIRELERELIQARADNTVGKKDFFVHVSPIC